MCEMSKIFQMSGVVEGGREYREGLLNASPFIDGDPRRPATTTMGRKGGQQVTPEHKRLASVYKIRFSLGAKIWEVWLESIVFSLKPQIGKNRGIKRGRIGKPQRGLE